MPAERVFGYANSGVVEAGTRVYLKHRGFRVADMNEKSAEYLAGVRKLAQAVFESDDAAQKWLVTPNEALNGSTPLALCATAKGAQQVKRVLNAIEFGGVV